MNYSSTFRVGRYTCTMTYDTGTKHLACEWDPHLPPRGELSRKELDQYRAGRDALMAKTGLGARRCTDGLLACVHRLITRRCTRYTLNANTRRCTRCTPVHGGGTRWSHDGLGINLG
jgi:hypothetical protein